MSREFNSAKLWAELEAAGLPIIFVSSDGRCDFARALDDTEEQTFRAIHEAHDPDALLPEEAEKLEDLQEVRASNRVAIALQQIDDDLALLPNATNAEFRQIVGRALLRQRQMIRALRHLA